MSITSWARWKISTWHANALAKGHCATLAKRRAFTIRATVKADIDTGDVEKFMEKDAEEISRIVANEKFIRIASRDAGGKRIHCPKNYPRG